MTRSALLAATAVAATTLSLITAGPAAAKPGDAACVWNKTDKADRDAFIAAWPVQGVKAGDPLLASLNSHPEILDKCGLKEADYDKSGRAVAAYIAARGAGAELKSRFGLTESAIKAAWMKLPADSRASFTANMVDVIFGRAGAHIDSAALNQLADILKVTDDEARKQLGFYLAGAEAAPAIEAQY